MFLFNSCKVYQKVDWIKPNLPMEERSKYFEPRQLSRISDGDSLYIKTIDNKSYDIIFSMVRNDSIQGLFWQKNNRRIKVAIETGIPISDIKTLKVKKFDMGTTILAVVSIPIVLWLFSLTITLPGIGFSGI